MVLLKEKETFSKPSRGGHFFVISGRQSRGGWLAGSDVQGENVQGQSGPHVYKKWTDASFNLLTFKKHYQLKSANPLGLAGMWEYIFFQTPPLPPQRNMGRRHHRGGTRKAMRNQHLQNQNPTLSTHSTPDTLDSHAPSISLLFILFYVFILI